MGARYASGKKAIAVCDVCGFQYKLNKLRKLVVNGHVTNVMACPTCWNEDHPQLQLGKYPVVEAEAVRNARPDTSYTESGSNGVGSRDIYWGWNPVGLNNPLGLTGLTDTLIGVGAVGTVTVTTG